MKRTILIFVFSLFILSCCATTKPNISVLYPIHALRTELPQPQEKSKVTTKEPLPIEVEALLKKLYTLDSNLALEVGKLPEFQETIGKNQVLALTRFIELVAHTTTSQKTNLAEFTKIGLPNVRRYCTPLQAIFWLLEKNEYDTKESPLNCNWSLSLAWCLNDLLTKAWDFSEEDRWKDYKVVTDRLNAPGLVNYYEKRRFIYVFRDDNVGRSYLLFKTNQGQCADVTAFTVDCLRKGGYKAWSYDVRSPRGLSFPLHHVTRFVMGGKHYIMDNSIFPKRGIVPLDKYSPF